MSLFAVSDLHISGSDDPLMGSVIKLLRERAASGDTVVLVGDVFDLFVGNKKVFTEKYAPLLSALDFAGRRGVVLHYVEGNHDFLIRRAFAGIPSLKVHDHDVSVEISGKRFFFAHGDTADCGDFGYRFMRFMFRSWLMRALVIAIPGTWLDWIGRMSSRYSRDAKPLLPGELPIERREKLRRIYRSYAAERMAAGYDFVVMGHCHDLDEMFFTVDGRSAQYVNIGFPRKHGSFLSWDVGDEKIQREAL